MVTVPSEPSLALSTLGCPDWNLDEVCTACEEYGYDGVDFRGYLDEPRDVTRHPQFAERVDEVTDRLAESGVAVSALSSSIRICNESTHDQDVAQAERFIALADELDVEYVRVFGVGDLDEHSRDELIEIGRETTREILDLPGARDVTWLLETHDNWVSSEDCLALLEAIDDPNVGLLWDAGHTTRVGDETPAETLDRVGDLLEYVHFKDAAYDPEHPDAMSDGWRYVLPGEGELPLGETIDELSGRGYDGWIMFEHEKRWHQELPEPEEAYAAFAEWFRSR